MNSDQLKKFKGKYILFEGLDSTGKSSVAKLMSELLTQNGIKNINTFEPGGDWNQLSVLIRSLCKDKRWNLEKESNLFIFMMDRIEHFRKVVEPNLKKGITVIQDRGSPSTIAYQLYGQQILRDIEKIHGRQVGAAFEKYISYPLGIKPDITYYFPIRVGKRVDSNNDKFDKASKEFIKRVEESYNAQYQQNNWIKVIPGKSAQETLENIFK